LGEVFRAIRRSGGGGGPDRAAETARLGRGVAGSGSRERCGSTDPCRQGFGMLEDRMVVILWVDAEDGRRVISMTKANGRERKRFARYLA